MVQSVTQLQELFAAKKRFQKMLADLKSAIKAKDTMNIVLAISRKRRNHRLASKFYTKYSIRSINLKPIS
jgi:hypothetical protein